LGFEPLIKISVESHISRIDKIYAVDKKNMNKMKQKMFAKRHTLENFLFSENVIEENMEEDKQNKEHKEKEQAKEYENDKQNNVLDSTIGLNSNSHLKNIFSKKSFFFSTNLFNYIFYYFNMFIYI